MFAFLAKTAIVAAIPKLVNETMEFLFAPNKPEVPVPVVKTNVGTKPRKKRDTTKITKYMYDYIVLAHGEWLNHNKSSPDNKLSMDWLVDKINAQMGTNKSKGALSSIWSRSRDREILEDGTAYFDY